MEKLQCAIPVPEFLKTCVDLPRFDACCRACPNYQSNWSCPPLPVPPMELWAQYDTLLLQCRRVDVPETLREQTYAPEELGQIAVSLLREQKREMLLELLEMEQQEAGSLVLAAGSCDLCPEGTCTRPQSLPCRHPEQMRYSLETLGGDMGKALELYFDRKMIWAENGHLPAYYILLGGLLKDRRARKGDNL